MWPEVLLALMLYVLITALFAAVLWPFRGASPIFWYPIALALIAIGIFIQIDFSHHSDGVHIVSSFIAVISFFVPAYSYSRIANLTAKLKIFKEKPVIDDTPSVRVTVFIIFILSIAMTILYFIQTGVNMIILAVTSGIEVDYSTIRLAMYAGENYTAAGYFNQFKNFLLPLTSALTIMYVWRWSRKVAYFFTPILVGVCVLAVAGTGQRTYLVFAFCATLFGNILYNLGRKKKYKIKMFISSMILFVGFSMMTALYRQTEGDIVQSVMLSIERIVFSQQWAGLEAFRFIYDRPIVWLQEWGDSIMGLLPGHRGSILANEIHNYMFQSFRGSAPPTLIGSAYYNGGIALVIATFAFLGFLYSYTYGLFLGGTRSPARCFGYGALFFYLTTFFVGTIKYPFDNGVVAFVLFLFLIRFRWGKRVAMLSRPG